MFETQEIICKCGCLKKKVVRVADIRRGWGKFFSKSCKAKWQLRNNPNSRYNDRRKGYGDLNSSEKSEENFIDSNWDDGDSEYYNDKDFN